MMMAVGSENLNVDDGDGSSSSSNAIMIQCDAPGCGTWYDAVDLNPPLDSLLASQYETWHCERCVPYHGPGRMVRRRAGLRKRKRVDFVRLNDPGVLLETENGHRRDLGVAANDVQDVDFAALIRRRRGRGAFRRGAGSGGCLLKLGKGEEFDAAYVAEHGFRRPVLFADKKPEQLGLRVPPPRDPNGAPFTYATVAELVGPFRPIQVIDTATQLTTEYTLKEWVGYLETPPKDRARTLNVITLEFSQTPLGKLVTEPKFARDVDFVNLHWPQTLEDIRKSTPCSDGAKVSSEDLLHQLEVLKKDRPRVSKYCLMSAAGSYTDFHIDFGGTAVWYHLFFGRKIFYFVEPTPENIKIYSKWATNARTKTSYEFLPDLILAAGGKVYEVTLRKGQTLFIPSGWIHAVFTPEDSLVFGGNFVHRHSLEMQLDVFRLERQMKVGRDFRFPNYQKLMWFCARDFLEECDRLRPRRPKRWDGKDFVVDSSIEQGRVQLICKKYSPHVLRGYRALARQLERWSMSKAKIATEQFPENMDVAKLSSRIGDLMKRCTIYIDWEEKEKLCALRK